MPVNQWLSPWHMESGVVCVNYTHWSSELHGKFVLFCITHTTTNVALFVHCLSPEPSNCDKISCGPKNCAIFTVYNFCVWQCRKVIYTLKYSVIIWTVAACAFCRGRASCLLAIPLEMYGSTISATRPVPVVDDAYPYPTYAKYFYPTG